MRSRWAPRGDDTMELPARQWDGYQQKYHMCSDTYGGAKDTIGARHLRSFQKLPSLANRRKLRQTQSDPHDVVELSRHMAFLPSNPKNMSLSTSCSFRVAESETAILSDYNGRSSPPLLDSSQQGQTRVASPRLPPSHNQPKENIYESVPDSSFSYSRVSSPENSPRTPPAISFTLPAHELQPDDGTGPRLSLKQLSPISPPEIFKTSGISRATDHERNNDDLAKTERLRLDIWTARSRSHTLRMELRGRRSIISMADDRYFQYLMARDRESSLTWPAGEGALVAPEELQRNCRLSREDYGALEDDYDNLQDQLDSLEYQLQKLEQGYAHRHRISYLHSPEDEDDDEVSRDSDSEVSTRSESGFVPEVHELVLEYQSAEGDLNILHERLDGYAEEKYVLEDRKATRQLVHMDLPEESQRWLDNFASMEASTLEEIVAAEEKSRRLKEQCLELGLVDENGNPTTFETRERQMFLREEIESSSSLSSLSKFPILISHQNLRNNPFRFSNWVGDFGSNAHAGEYIDQWLLDQLHSSSLCVCLLASTFEFEFGKIERHQWQLDVLEFWFIDGAGKAAYDYRVHSTGIATQTTQKSTPRLSGFTEDDSFRISRSTSFDSTPNALHISGLVRLATSDQRAIKSV